jgi:hypothetical protein
MTPRDGAAPRRVSRGTGAATEDYESGYRFGQAWLLTDDGREWQQGLVSETRSPVRALRRLSLERSRDYLRGFYDSVMKRPGAANVPVQRTPRRTRPITVSVALSTDEYAIVKALQAADGVPMATRLRAILMAYATDPRVREAVEAARARL